MGFDAGRFFGDLAGSIQRDVADVIGMGYVVPKDANEFLERAKKNVKDHYITYTIVGLIVASIISLFETSNFIGLFLFVAVLIAYLVVKQVDDTILAKSKIEPEYVHIIGLLFYIIVAMIADIVTFSLFVLFVVVIGVLVLAALQVKGVKPATKEAPTVSN